MKWIRSIRGLLNVRTVTLTLAMVLSMSTVAGGTLAWLMDTTNTLKNTFTFGDVNITLTETQIGDDGQPELDADGNPVQTTEGQDYKMLPGTTISKDPKVTVKAGTEDCWLFVKVDERWNFSQFMTYEIRQDGWTFLSGINDAEAGAISSVYYRTVNAADVKDADLVFSVLKDDQVRMLESVTKEQLSALTPETYPTLSFTAYAVQRDAEIESVATAEAAWQIALAEQMRATNSLD